MSQSDKLFKVEKASIKEKLNNKEKIENTLYIYKDSSSRGKIYFDYDENHRLEINPSDSVYSCKRELREDIEIISTTDIKKIEIINNNKQETDTNINDVTVGSLIVSTNRLYNVAKTDVYNNIIVAIKVCQGLMWNEYYE